MADVNSLKDSISELPEIEVTSIILDVRQARREEREARVKRRKSPKKKAGSKKKKKKDLASMIGNMSKEQAMIILNQLKE